jgi:AcrR family transcriptional regulator
MARQSLHDPAGILDAARSVVLDGGPRAATVAAIAGASGAPTGSIYHRFGSRETLLARLWIRAAQGSQERFLEAMRAEPDPEEATVAAALSIFDFTRDAFPDARLLASLRREDLVGAAANAELELLNAPIEEGVRELARRLGGAAPEEVALAALDLPHGAVRRHLVAGRRPPERLRRPVELAVRAVVHDITRRST